MQAPSIRLARNCANRAPHLVEQLVVSSEMATIGTFDCPVAYASFRDTGPIERYIVVFPRTGVWIRHHGSRRFLADPSVVTIYNRSQGYERFQASPEGDRCDWFAVSEPIARAIAGRFDEAAADSSQPFRFEWAPCTPQLYLRQRALLERARRGSVDGLELDEAVLTIVHDAIAASYDARRRALPRRSHAERRQRELVDSARLLLLESACDNRSLGELAGQLHCSGYHLCHTFRRLVGTTMSAYRTALRVRLALVRLVPEDDARSLSALAHDLGFSSHSHFVNAMRRHAGMTPGAARDLLNA